MDVVLSYCHNTLNDRTLRPLLPYFQSKGVGVISASFSSMGMFTKQARSPQSYKGRVQKFAVIMAASARAQVVERVGELAVLHGLGRL